jgi:D-glycerate 3-kinase
MAAFVCALLGDAGLPGVALSLDDLYLDPEHRPAHIHPLFATRGVPGTHDVKLGIDLITRLSAANAGTVTAIPRFDKSSDRRAPETEWGRFHGPARVVLMEGWCVGVPPQPDAALGQPVNALEAQEDPDGTWRNQVNAYLCEEYRALFERLSSLIFLAAPSFDCVFGWRQLQETKLRARAGGDAPGLMTDEELRRFIQHYERLTRHALTVLPGRADIVAKLGHDQSIVGLSPAL